MFSGAIVAIVTPFKAGGVRRSRLEKPGGFPDSERDQRHLPCGTTGKSPTLSYEEHERVVEIVIEQSAGRVPVIAGAGSNSTKEAISLTAHAKKAGADAASLIAPYYNKPTQEGLYRHFEAVAKAVDIPIIVYDVPGRTAVNIEPATMERLSQDRQHRRCQGIRRFDEADHGHHRPLPAGFHGALRRGLPHFSTPVRRGQRLISVVSNVAPRQMADLCSLFSEGRFEESRRLYYKLLPLFAHSFYRDQPGPGKGRPGHDGQDRIRGSEASAGDHVGE